MEAIETPPGVLYVFGAAQDNPFHPVNQCLPTGK
jgi:hypothetical protein